MVVSTPYRTSAGLNIEAITFSQRLNALFIPRGDKSITRLMQEGEEPVFIYGEQDIKVYRNGWKEPFFFHPNFSKVRIKRLLNGDNDRMTEVCNLSPGDSFLDGTLGLGADAIVASHVVGPTGRVVGVEAEKWVYEVVSDGLKRRKDDFLPLLEAMHRVEVVHADILSYLQQCDDCSFDVVYFDPMFRKTVEQSSGISVLRHLSDDRPLSPLVVKEACRVARKSVVLKDRKESSEFQRLGFRTFPVGNRIMYGVIHIND